MVDESAQGQSPETLDEQTAEQEALTEVHGDDLREKLAEEFGIDPDEQSDLLEKVVERELANRKKLSDAIRQKRTWRDKATKSTSNQGTRSEGESQTSNKTPDIDAIVSQKLNSVLEQRDLESLNLPEELQAEVKKLAKVNGTTIREAAKDPYFVYKREQFEKDESIKNATPKRKGSRAYPAYDPSKPLNASDFNLHTEEGRKAWEEAKSARDQSKR
jgi:hypothetical protein